jgi:hypothetical protein
MAALAATPYAMVSIALVVESTASNSAQKTALETPKRPGWPAGVPDSQGGKFRPKTPEEIAADRAKGSLSKPPKAGSGMTEVLAEAVKTAIRIILAQAESTPDPRVRIAALLAEVGLEAYPYVSAYFDSPKSFEELQAAAQSPSDPAYENVEQATANSDGSEAAQI